MSASVRLSRSRTRARCSGRSVSRRRPLASCPWQAAPGPSWSRPRVDDGRPAGTAARGSRESPSSLGMCDVPILWVPAGPQCCQHGRFPREGILSLPPPFQGPRRRAARFKVSPPAHTLLPQSCAIPLSCYHLQWHIPSM